MLLKSRRRNHHFQKNVTKSWMLAICNAKWTWSIWWKSCAIYSVHEKSESDFGKHATPQTPQGLKKALILKNAKQFRVVCCKLLAGCYKCVTMWYGCVLRTILVWKLFTRSTIFTRFCSFGLQCPHWKIQRHFVKLFRIHLMNCFQMVSETLKDNWEER